MQTLTNACVQLSLSLSLPLPLSLSLSFSFPFLFPFFPLFLFLSLFLPLLSSSPPLLLPYLPALLSFPFLLSYMCVVCICSAEYKASLIKAIQDNLFTWRQAPHAWAVDRDLFRNLVELIGKKGRNRMLPNPPPLLPPPFLLLPSSSLPPSFCTPPSRRTCRHQR